MTNVIRFDPDPDLQPSRVMPRQSFTTDDTTDLAHSFFAAENGSVQTGVWEGAPARFEIDGYPSHELMAMLSGSVTITDLDTGRAEVFTAGDTFFVTKGSRIIWETTATMRKYYVIVPDAAPGAPEASS
ncbi:MAG: cupin domain-containing protein [Acidimicrobiales bacterium]